MKANYSKVHLWIRYIDLKLAADGDRQGYMQIFFRFENGTTGTVDKYYIYQRQGRRPYYNTKPDFFGA